MITGKDIYDVVAAIVPLYVALVLGYGSVRWWRVLTPEQCVGVSRFVSVYALPMMSFQLISSNDPYSMNYRLLAADSLQKVVILVALFLWTFFSTSGSVDWVITLFSLSSLPNTLVIGIPLLRSMYGDFSTNLLVQIVVLQVVIWYTLLLFMFEYRGAKLLIKQQFPETGAAITSIRVESDVTSLNGSDFIHTDTEIDDDGKLHVVIKRLQPDHSSNLSDVEIYSVQSSRHETPIYTSFNRNDSISKRSYSHRYTKSLDGGSVGSFYGRNKDLHMFVWSPSASSVGSNDFSRNVIDSSKPVFQPNEENKQQMPVTSVMTRLILVMVWRRLIRNPNTYASVFGFVWSLISYRLHLKLPSIVRGSVSILSNTGLGMAMFSLGLFMGLQPKMIGCGKSAAVYSMVVRFIAGPAVIVAASFAVGLRGILLRVAILQAALPQGIVPFVYAKDYNVHADVLSTAVIFGMMIALPITILYYTLLGLV